MLIVTTANYSNTLVREFMHHLLLGLLGLVVVVVVVVVLLLHVLV